MKRYHMRNEEQEIKDVQEMKRILSEQPYVTIAMCVDGEPYLVSLTHAYDETEHCIYFHCGKAGKKIDFLKANPVVWGQVIEDGGYKQDACYHAFKTVQFHGSVEFLAGCKEKRKALELLIEQREEHPEPLKKKYITKDAIEKVVIGKVTIDVMTGKSNIRQT